MWFHGGQNMKTAFSSPNCVHLGNTCILNIKDNLTKTHFLIHFSSIMPVLDWLHVTDIMKEINVYSSIYCICKHQTSDYVFSILTQMRKIT
jgi:hypothetical protein